MKINLHITQKMVYIYSETRHRNQNFEFFQIIGCIFTPLIFLVNYDHAFQFAFPNEISKRFKHKLQSTRLKCLLIQGYARLLLFCAKPFTNCCGNTIQFLLEWAQPGVKETHGWTFHPWFDDPILFPCSKHISHFQLKN